jgi:hypothetical protein
MKSSFSKSLATKWVKDSIPGRGRSITGIFSRESIICKRVAEHLALPTVFNIQYITTLFMTVFIFKLAPAY